jgi:hypothetical protein
MDAYQRAVADAAIAEPGEVVTALTPVAPDTPGLCWHDFSDAARVPMVTWAGDRKYDSHVGAAMVLSSDVWVTAAPEVHRFAARMVVPPDRLVLRLELPLGLSEFVVRLGATVHVAGVWATGAYTVPSETRQSPDERP